MHPADLRCLSSFLGTSPYPTPFSPTVDRELPRSRVSRLGQRVYTRPTSIVSADAGYLSSKETKLNTEGHTPGHAVWTLGSATWTSGFVRASLTRRAAPQWPYGRRPRGPPPQPTASPPSPSPWPCTRGTPYSGREVGMRSEVR